MAWLAQYGSTIVVLLIVIAVVVAILRSMVKNKTLSCDGCTEDCACCGGVCPTATIELSDEQTAALEAFEAKGGNAS